MNILRRMKQEGAEFSEAMKDLWNFIRTHSCRKAFRKMFRRQAIGG